MFGKAFPQLALGPKPRRPQAKAFRTHCTMPTTATGKKNVMVNADSEPEQQSSRAVPAQRFHDPGGPELCNRRANRGVSVWPVAHIGHCTLDWN